MFGGVRAVRCSRHEDRRVGGERGRPGAGSRRGWPSVGSRGDRQAHGSGRTVRRGCGRRAAGAVGGTGSTAWITPAQQPALACRRRRRRARRRTSRRRAVATATAPRRRARGQARGLDGQRPHQERSPVHPRGVATRARLRPRCRPPRPTPTSSPRSTSSRRPRSPISTTTSRATSWSSARSRPRHRARPGRRHPGPPRPGRRPARERGRHRDLLRRAADGEPPPQGRGDAATRGDRAASHTMTTAP